MWIHIPLESYHSAPVAEGLKWDLDSISQMLAQSVTWRSKLMSARFWKNACGKESWMMHLSGQILNPLTANRGVEKWIASLPDIHANHFQSQAKNSAKKTRDISGRRSVASSENANRQFAFWKMSEPIYEWGLNKSTMTFAQWVTKLRAACLQRKKWVRRTNEKDCLSWPTILVSCGKGVSAKELSSGNPRFRLDVAVRLWPTATVMDSAIQTVRPAEKMIRKDGRNVLRIPSLAETVLRPQDFPRYKQDLEKSWRTPCASDGEGGLMYPIKNGSPRLKLRDQSVHMTLSPYGHHVPVNKNNGKESRQTLNPQFTEWLMGWPIGWTDFAPVEMEWYHWWRRMRSEFFALISKI